MRPVQPETMIEATLASAEETGAAGAALARLARRGDVIALRGDLGAGKTTFARGFIAALAGAGEAVPSPTFTLVQTYPARIDGTETDIWHFDLYRLKHAEEAYELGIEEAFAEGVSLVEWPERLGGLLPRRRLDVTLLPGTRPDSRRLRIAGGDGGGWELRLAQLVNVLAGKGDADG